MANSFPVAKREGYCYNRLSDKFKKGMEKHETISIER